MVSIDNLSDAADQTTTLQIYDGTNGQLELIYMGSTQRWIFNFTHPDFPDGSINGQMLCVHPNILRQFKNFLSFGMSCVSNDGTDPVNIEDFANGKITLYILNATEVQTVEQTFFGAFA